MINGSIYDIDPAILDCIDEDGEIIDFEAYEARQTEMEWEIGIDNMVCWYKQLIADAGAIKAEYEKLRERERKKENLAERVKVFLAARLDGRKFETARNKITWRESKPVIILDEKAIPKAYMREKVTAEPDKAAIKEAIINGQAVPGAELVVRNNIQIQ